MSKQQATLYPQANSNPASESSQPSTSGGGVTYFCEASDVTMYSVKSSQIRENKLI